MKWGRFNYSFNSFSFWRRKHEHKYIDKIKEGVKFYTKPEKRMYKKGFKYIKLNRRLETKRVMTHTKK